jgi:radical SAM superfamily enzyme YgiQ (UPF0313 family)
VSDSARARLAGETAYVAWSDAPSRCLLAYPSPYHVGMSSLGFQQIYRAVLDTPGWTPVRVFNNDDEGRVPYAYELRGAAVRPQAIAFSVAYELEIVGLIQMLERFGMEPLRRHRSDADPPVILGGPLTFSNPTPLLPFCDVLVCGEAEHLIGPVLEGLADTPRSGWHERLAHLDGVVVPVDDKNPLSLSVAKADDVLLPAHSAIVTPHTELSNMYLIEPERGCSRQCTYCVMRRSTNGGMRRVAKDRILSLIPEGVEKVGLVGAAVTDHIELPEILEGLIERGLKVGISSLRADRLKGRLVPLLYEAGYRSMTVALDGASPRLRRMIQRKTEDLHFPRVAAEAKAAGFMQMKVYMVLGLPTETDEDIDILAEELRDLSRILPVEVGLCPLVPKRNTPLWGVPFVGVKESDRRLKRLRKALAGRGSIRPVSSRWAWIESVLARGGVKVGEEMVAIARAGGRFADYRKAFAEMGYFPDGRVGPDRAPVGVDGGLPYGVIGREVPDA